jgi:hypothetical protein
MGCPLPGSNAALGPNENRARHIATPNDPDGEREHTAQARSRPHHSISCKITSAESIGTGPIAAFQPASRKVISPLKTP